MRRTLIPLTSSLRKGSPAQEKDSLVLRSYNPTNLVAIELDRVTPQSATHPIFGSRAIPGLGRPGGS